MPAELRARSRTPSRGNQGSSSPASPKKNADSCCAFLQKLCPCPKMNPQRRNQCAAIGMGLTALLIVVGSICTVHHRVEVKLNLGTLTERLAFAFRCLLISGCVLAGAVKYVAFKRFSTSAFNPLSGNERNVEAAQRILQNTLEQFVLHSCAVLAVTTYLSADQMKFIPLLVALFVVGRIFFFLGYPTKRCFGFALSWLSNCVASAVTFYYMFTRGIAVF